jgi:uncharacterized protein (TIGR00375 family)
MKCLCGGRIKKGVDYRISEIADLKSPKHPKFRGKYIHLMPLAEIISMVYEKGVTTKTVQNKWQKLIDTFGPEINILLDTPLNKIKKIDSDLSVGIDSFRNNSLHISPGGGGKYGSIDFDKNIDKKRELEKRTTLDSF